MTFEVIYIHTKASSSSSSMALSKPSQSKISIGFSFVFLSLRSWAFAPELGTLLNTLRVYPSYSDNSISARKLLPFPLAPQIDTTMTYLRGYSLFNSCGKASERSSLRVLVLRRRTLMNYWFMSRACGRLLFSNLLTVTRVKGGRTSGGRCSLSGTRMRSSAEN
jgi:hypothetical protein